MMTMFLSGVIFVPALLGIGLAMFGGQQTKRV